MNKEKEESLCRLCVSPEKPLRCIEREEHLPTNGAQRGARIHQEKKTDTENCKKDEGTLALSRESKL